MQATLAATTLIAFKIQSIALKLHLIAFKNIAMELGSVESGVKQLREETRVKKKERKKEKKKEKREVQADVHGKGSGLSLDRRPKS